MEDIEMNINQMDLNPQNKDEEDSFKALDNIQIQLKIINNTFTNSLNHIKIFSPFIEKGTEQNMEKEQHDFRKFENYDENRENFDETLKSFGDQMNNHFDQLLEMTKKLKKFEEFNMTENQLKEKLNKLKEQNEIANDEMNKKLKNIENIFNELNADNSMKNENIIRDEYEDNLEI